MNILVLNGSPKGQYSVTLQTSLYLEIKRPKHHFRVLDVGQRIRTFERDFTEAREAIEWADLVIFSYPVYTFLAPSQLHRFIELMKENRVEAAGKFATQITTSKHFYDVTAHRYIEDNCRDMGFRFIQGLSADMDDLTTQKGRREARAFFDYTVWQMKTETGVPIRSAEEAGKEPDKETRNETAGETRNEAGGDTRNETGSDTRNETAGDAGNEMSSGEEAGPEDVVIVADLGPEDVRLSRMIRSFREALPFRSRVVNIREYPFKGGCLGCFRCAVTGQCVYTDGFDRFLRENIQSARATVYAFTVRDHSMGARFKMYDDRQFCNGHRTVTMGKPVGYLISGDYSRETNLKMVVEARAQVGGNFLAGVATDETDPEQAAAGLAGRLAYVIRRRVTQPQNFYGVGGMKIFRDLIYVMRGMMKADHEFYKSHGQYDFPQKQKGRIAMMYLVGGLLSSPKVLAKMGNRMNEGMLMPYRQVLKRAAAGRSGGRKTVKSQEKSTDAV